MRKFVFPLVLLVAVAAYVGHWFYVAAQVEGAVADWAKDNRRQGRDVRYGAIETAGFPFKLRIAVADVEISGALKDIGWTWRAPMLRVLLRPWGFDRILLTLPPAHELILEQAGRRYDVAIAQDSNQVAIVTDDGALAVLGLDALGLRMSDETGAAFAARTLKVRLEQGDDDGDGDGGATLGLQVESLRLPEAPPGFPNEIASLTAIARLLGGIPPGEVRASLATWREAGGTVETPRLHLVWGELDVEGDGALALDAAFRPIGAFRLKLAGYALMLAAGAATGVLEPFEATAIRAALDLVAKPGEDGGRPRAEIAVSAQDGVIYVGPIAVGKLAPLPLD